MTFEESDIDFHRGAKMSDKLVFTEDDFSLGSRSENEDAAAMANKRFNEWLEKQEQIVCYGLDGKDKWWRRKDKDVGAYCHQARLVYIEPIKEKPTAIHCRGCGNIYRRNIPKECLNCGVEL